MKFAAFTSLGVVLLFTSAFCQVTQHFNFSGGAGVSLPTSDAGKNLNTGFDLDFRGGYNLSSHLAADLDFGYNYWNLNSAALASFGEPGGHVRVWSLTFNPVVHLLPHRSPVNAYATAGFGLYERTLILTQPSTVTSFFCDPFFGCYPATFAVNQVVASFNTYKLGYNAGGGLEFRLGDRQIKFFSEAKYQRMFNSNGSDVTFLPVTFGLRW